MILKDAAIAKDYCLYLFIIGIVLMVFTYLTGAFVRILEKKVRMKV
jgi:hypothetical protein